MFQKALKTIVFNTKYYFIKNKFQINFFCSKTKNYYTEEKNKVTYLDQRLLNYITTLQNELNNNEDVTNVNTNSNRRKKFEFTSISENLIDINTEKIFNHNCINKYCEEHPDSNDSNITASKGAQNKKSPDIPKTNLNEVKIDESYKKASDQNRDVTILKNSSNSEFLGLIRIFLNQNCSNFLKNLIEIDHECCKRLPNLNQNQILSILNIFSNFCPYYARDLKFLTVGLKKLGFSINRLDRREIIQLAHYAGLLKKNQNSQKILRFILNKFNNKKVLRALNLHDIIILANSAFKSSTRITQNFILDEIRMRLTNFLEILNDEPYFVTLVKSLRHNFNYDEELLITLALAMSFNKTIEKYNFTALAHIFTLYADALYNDPVLIENFTKIGLVHLKNSSNLITERSHFSKNLRPKDLSRFLYSLSYLGSDNFLTNNDFKLIILPLIKNFLSLGTLEKNLNDFLSIFLSLWILGYWDEKILLDCLKEHLVSKGKQKNAFTSRLNILLTSIKIEEPLIFEKLKLNTDPSPNFNINTQIDKRLCLVKIFNALKSLVGKYDGSIEYSYAIPHLNIVGITMYDKNKKILAYIECVDESNCSKYVEISPHGYMKLKLRLLKAIKKPLLVVDKETIEDMDSIELGKYLDKKLKIAIYLNNR